MIFPRRHKIDFDLAYSAIEILCATGGYKTDFGELDPNFHHLGLFDYNNSIRGVISFNSPASPVSYSLKERQGSVKIVVDPQTDGLVKLSDPPVRLKRRPLIFWKRQRVRTKNPRSYSAVIQDLNYTAHWNSAHSAFEKLRGEKTLDEYPLASEHKEILVRRANRELNL